MANAKIISYVDSVFKKTEAERQQDVHALIHTFEDELAEVHKSLAATHQALADVHSQLRKMRGEGEN